MNNQEPQLQPINTMADLRAAKDTVSHQLRADEERMAGMWHSLFAPKDKAALATPTARLTRMVGMGAGIVDGVLLGWKLYKKYQGAKNFFGLRKKKR